MANEADPENVPAVKNADSRATYCLMLGSKNPRLQAVVFSALSYVRLGWQFGSTDTNYKSGHPRYELWLARWWWDVQRGAVVA
jgi:hypothetical protein